jgi:DNA-binding MarR family transcriptional regulator
MQGVQFATFDFTPFQAVVYIHRASCFEAYQSKILPMSPRPTAPNFTPKQGQYLAFIYAYTHVLGRPPAEADLQRHFGVSPPSVHQMVLTLERTGLIRRQPGVARSIEVLVAPELLPVLR